MAVDWVIWRTVKQHVKQEIRFQVPKLAINKFTFSRIELSPINYKNKCHHMKLNSGQQQLVEKSSCSRASSNNNLFLKEGENGW